ncbi:MAG: PilZ domain-containing protein [Bryobacteraceae bacterium]|nr:PilZ domain-containing protein [Bryobacteraceae bacterium]
MMSTVGKLQEELLPRKVGGTDRRSSDRFPIEREVRYRVLGKRVGGEAEEGTGLTVNISSNGVLFTTNQELIPGRRLELSISWPAELDNRCQLKLVAKGRVARLEEGRAAVEISQYEFRTAGRVVPATATN